MKPRLPLRLFLVLCALAGLVPVESAQKLQTGTGQAREIPRGIWRAYLETPGGQLPFELDLLEAEGVLRAFVVNGPERIEIPTVVEVDEKLLLRFDHYDSYLALELNPGGKNLVGRWSKQRGAGEPTQVPAFAAHSNKPRFKVTLNAGDPVDINGRWRAQFASDELPSVAIFENGNEHLVTGTFLTATGDYRWLAGQMERRMLRLSCFDGAHAFLFKARLRDDGTFQGDFYSGDWYHDTWTAERDPEATLGDAFAQTTWLESAALADLVVPDLDGKPHSLAGPPYQGKATILQLFGSWCPNCHDETRYLVELHERYRERGLSVLGLAFELTGDFARDAEQVKVFADHHGVEYPLFVVGTANKAAAGKAFPLIDRVRSYPTTIFLGADGSVRAVHSGFAGPATGEEHTKLRAEFEGLIEELLTEEPPSDEDTWQFLCESPWWSRTEFAGARYHFRTNEAGAREVLYELMGSGRPVIREDVLPVELRGQALRIGEQVWRVDRRAGVLLDPRSIERRLYPWGGDGISPLLAELGFEGTGGWQRALTHTDPLVRREALVALTYEAAPRSDRHVQGLVPLLTDLDLGVCAVAAWCASETRDPAATEALIANLASPNAALRRESATALGNLAVPRVKLLEYLLELQEDPDPLVRAAVEDALNR